MDIAAALACLVVVCRHYAGVRIPDSFFERGEYTARLYVSIIPEGEKVARQVPATVHATLHGETHIYTVETLELPSGEHGIENAAPLEMGEILTPMKIVDGPWCNIAVTTMPVKGSL